jgi:hypothetical protein
MSGKHSPKYKKVHVDLPKGKLTLYAGKQISHALAEVTEHMDLYKGVRFFQVMQAVYDQGLKDGRKEVIERFDGLKEKLNYLPPGRPKK